MNLRMLLTTPIFRTFADRRKKDVPVIEDRRRPTTVRESDEHLNDALKKMDDATRPIKREVANDVQHTVIFTTFRDICKFIAPGGAIRICRHEKHEAANSGVAICNEEQCPFMRGVA